MSRGHFRALWLDKAREANRQFLPNLDRRRLERTVLEELGLTPEEEKRHRYKTAIQQARALLDLASFVLPRKITDETIGDAVEALEKAAKEGAHPWKLQAKALICVFWAVLFTLRELAKPAALLAALWRLLSGSLW